MKKNSVIKISLLSVLLVISVVVNMVPVSAIDQDYSYTTTLPDIVSGGEHQILTLGGTTAITYNQYDSASFSLNVQNASITAKQRFMLKNTGGGKYEIITMDGTNSSEYLLGIENGSLTVSSPTGEDEQRWFLISSGGGYIIKSAYNENYSIAYSGSSVFLSTSNTNNLWRIRFICYDVPLYKQQDYNTCSAACVKMLLEYYGIIIQESDYTDAYNDVEDLFSFHPNMTDYINSKLEEDGHPIYYESLDYVYEVDFEELVIHNIVMGNPMIVLIKIPYDYYNLFGYSSNGHYVVITGVFYDTSASEYKVVINDPSDVNNSYKEMVIPLSTLCTLCYEHDVNPGRLIRVGNNLAR